jgi:hypothetical protein
MNRLYFAVLDTVDLGHQILSVAHGMMMAHLRFNGNPEYDDWLKNSFRKCVCRVNAKEFAKLRELDDVVIVTEMALDYQEIAIVICPRKEYPNVVKYMKLFS